MKPLDEHLSVRYLPLTFEAGSTQLARTEAVMNEVAAGRSPSTLMLYSWSEPVLILGVGQSSSDVDSDASASDGIRVLRRIGGGTAVYHDRDEVSIDLITPVGHSLDRRDVHQGYRLFAEILAAALRRTGVNVATLSVEDARTRKPDVDMTPICFGSVSPFEFEFDGRKLNGLCQIRRRGVTAIQTAIYFRFKPDPLIRLLVHPGPETRQKRADLLENRVTDLARAGMSQRDFLHLGDAITSTLPDQTGVAVEPGQFTSRENEMTRELITSKYEDPGWTFRR